MIAGCGARTDLHPVAASSDVPVVRDAQADVAVTTSIEGIVRGNCAPNDGPALDLLLLAAPIAACSATTDARITVSFWSPIPARPGTYTVGDGSFASGSNASVCVAGGACTNAARGTVTFTTFDAPGFTGSVDLDLPDGTHRHADFARVARCAAFVGCG